jgi:hypothetical protein
VVVFLEDGGRRSDEGTRGTAAEREGDVLGIQRGGNVVDVFTPGEQPLVFHVRRTEDGAPTEDITPKGPDELACQLECAI